jgi:hypothetical protein
MHDAGIAPAFRGASFTLADGDVEVFVTEGTERHRAIWERTAVDAADTASVIKAILKVEATVEPDPDDGFWESFGDIRSMQELADRLKAVGTAAVTPWGIALRAPDGRDLATIGVEGRGTFHVHLVLPSGFGAKATKKRSETVLGWFERTLGADWRDHGFTTPRKCGVSAIYQGGGPRWSVVVATSFDAFAISEADLVWARDHGILDFPVSP